MSKLQRLARNHFDAVVYKQITAMKDWIDAHGVHRYVRSHPMHRRSGRLIGH